MSGPTEPYESIATRRPQGRVLLVVFLVALGGIASSGVVYGIWGEGRPWERWLGATVIAGMASSVGGVVALSTVWRVELAGDTVTVRTLIGRPVARPVAEVTEVVAVAPSGGGVRLPTTGGGGDGLGCLIMLVLWPLLTLTDRRVEARADPARRGGFQVRFRSGPPLHLSRQQMAGVDDLVSRLPVRPTG